MKKFTSILCLAALACLLIMSHCKKDEEETPDPPSKYKVDYHCDIVGPFTDLRIIYLNNNHEFQEINVQTVPWDLEFDDFNYGDSVYIRMIYKILPSATPIHAGGWEWAITATDGTNTPIDKSSSFGGSLGIIQDTIYRDEDSGTMVISWD